MDPDKLVVGKRVCVKRNSVRSDEQYRVGDILEVTCVEFTPTVFGSKRSITFRNPRTGYKIEAYERSWFAVHCLQEGDPIDEVSAWVDKVRAS